MNFSELFSTLSVKVNKISKRLTDSLYYSDTHCLQTILLIFKFCQPQNKRILCFDSQ